MVQGGGERDLRSQTAHIVCVSFPSSTSPLGVPEQVRLQLLQALLLLMPDENRIALQTLLVLLGEVADHCEDNQVPRPDLALGWVGGWSVWTNLSLHLPGTNTLCTTPHATTHMHTHTPHTCTHHTLHMHTPYHTHAHTHAHTHTTTTTSDGC